MEIGKIAAVGALIVGVAVTAYMIGGSQANRSAPAPAPVGAVPQSPAPATAADQPDTVPMTPASQPSHFTHFRVGQRNVKRLHVDGSVVWVGTSGGLIRYDSHADEYRLIDNRSGLLANGIFYVGKLDGRIAVGTYGGGFALLGADGDSWEHYNVPDGLGDAFVYDAALDADGDLWIATWSGVNRVRGGVAGLDRPENWELFTVENTDGGLPNDWVYALAPAEDGVVWMATEGGLAVWRDGEWSNWNHADGLGAAFDLVRDDIRFLTDPAEVSDHHAKQKQDMGLSDIGVAYNPNYVVSLELDGSGGVWAGTWGGGLSHFDGQDWRNYTVRDGLPSSHVFALYRDPDGTLWVGTSHGMARLQDDRFHVYTTEHGLFADAVFSIATIPNQDSVWVGSYGGVARLVGVR